MALFQHPNTAKYPVDLHMHSTMSDGRLEPHELVRLAKERGVKVISLTDHDTIDGLDQAREAALAAGITLVNGVELSASLEREVHILGYFFDAEHSELRRVLAERRTARIERVYEICRRLERLGYPVTPEAVFAEADGNVGRPHVAQALVNAGHVKTTNDAFKRLLRNEGPAYVMAARMTAADAIALIHRAGGVASIAHPGVDKLTNRLGELANLGLDAVEIEHPSHSASQRSRLRRAAQETGLAVSGGSDLHHTDGPWQLGQSGVTEDELAVLRERSAKRRAA